jgi:hypothetical protein
MWYPARHPSASGRPAPLAHAARPGGRLAISPHPLPRRRLLRSAAAASALALGARLWSPAIDALAAGGDEALPIPGGNDFLEDGHFVHVFVPAFGSEPSTVNHFNGFVAAAEIQGTGTGTDTATGKTTRYYYDADMRFMDGEYIGADGRVRHGTFAFV